MKIDGELSEVQPIVASRLLVDSGSTIFGSPGGFFSVWKGYQGDGMPGRT